MAEILVVAVPGRSSPRGTVVAIEPAGHAWGREERPPTFRVLRVMDAAPDDLRYLMRRPNLVVGRLTETRLDLDIVPDRPVTLSELTAAERKV